MVSIFVKDLVTAKVASTEPRLSVKSMPADLLINLAVTQNVVGNTHISLEAIGAPYRLVTTKDGTVKFKKNGLPSMTLAKDLRDFGNMVHANFLAGIQAENARIYSEQKEECEALVASAVKAGQPIKDTDDRKLADALKALAEAEAKAETEALIPERELVPA